MKKLILNIILLLLFNINMSGTMYSTSSYICNRPIYNNTISKNTNSISTIGYTTHTGYSTYGKYKGTYMVSTTMSNRNYYSIGTTSKYIPTQHNSGPRKSKERPYSGKWIEDLADWWRMNTDSNWPSYVDEEYWEEFLAEYPEYEDDAREWFEEHGQKFPPDPPEPFLEPIGNIPSHLFLILAAGYGLYKHKKRDLRRQQKQKQS